MKQRDSDAFEEIRNLCKLIIRETHTLAFEDFLSDQNIFDATLWRISIIGESANRVSADFFDEHPDFSLKPAISMRHRIIHGYDSISAESVYEVATIDIPDLLTQLDERGL